MFGETVNVYKTASDINSSMLRVYNHMCLAVCTSGIVAALVASSHSVKMGGYICALGNDFCLCMGTGTFG